MIIIGVDPGITGAWAAVKDGQLIALDELPTVGDGTSRMVSGELFAGSLEHFAEREGEIDRVVIERVSGAPIAGRTQGTSSMFRFGRAAGIAEGVAAGLSIPVRQVEPQVWKRHFGLIGKDKEASRELAIRMFPDIAHLAFRRKADHGKAEAALIAVWGYRAAQAAGEAA